MPGDELKTLTDIPCPNCGTKNNLTITGGTYVNIVTCMACGNNWPVNRFNEELKKMGIKENSAVNKIRRAIRKPKAKPKGKAKTPVRIFCPYCGSKLKNGACTNKKCATKK